MSNDINLLKKNKNQFQDLSPTLKKVRTFGIISLFLVCILSVGLFIVKLQSPISQLQAEEEVMRTRVKQLSKKQTKTLFIKERLQNINQILATRTQFEKLMNNMTQIMPSGVTVDAFSIDKKQANLTVTSPSLLPLKEFTQRILDYSEAKKEFLTVVIENTAYSEQSHLYKLSIVFTFI